MLLALPAAADEGKEGKPKTDYRPVVHGTLRGKYEYQPEEKAGRFQVRTARVSIEGKTVASIGTGLVVLVGFGPDDTAALRESGVWSTLIEKMIGLRIFPDEEGKMNRSMEAFGGEIMLVSQFTLYADC